MRTPRQPMRVAAVGVALLVGVLEIGDGGGGVHAFRGSALHHRQSVRGQSEVPSIRIPFAASTCTTQRDQRRCLARSLRSSNTDGNNGTAGGAALGPKAERRSRGSGSRRRSSDRRKGEPKQIPSSSADENNKSFEAAEPPILSDDENNNNGAVAAVGPKAAGRLRGNSASSRRGSDRRTGPRKPRETSSSPAPGPVAAGPRSARRRSTGPRSTGPRAAGPRSTGPRSVGPRPDRSARRRRNDDGPEPQPQQARREREPPKPAREPFDNKVFASRQTSNPEAPRLDLRETLISSSTTSFRCVTPGLECFESADRQDKQRPNDPFEYRSLDDLLSSALSNQGIESESKNGLFSLSKKFNSDEAFRNDLRSAIRLDVFETTPFYARLPEKAKSVLLLPDSSLEGSWRIPEKAETGETEDDNNGDDGDEKNPPVRRMKYTTLVLNQALEEHYGNQQDSGGGDASDHRRFRFTGDDLFEAIGNICGDGASTHWIDIYGVQDREINHSWHLDAGRSPKNCRTVLWGFPPENHYEGTGVFSHIVSLEDPFGSTLDIVEEEDRERPRMEPVLFEGTPGEDFVFRPVYHAGKELLIYRDIDVLHSAPDVAYRTSVMRFM